ncbi:MAG: hypothetical protein JW888_14210 [Pirellulales bacterium]|nr:hypothetical protein [Pirellulales bacterium]
MIVPGWAPRALGCLEAETQKTWEEIVMDKKAKKKIQTLHERLQKLRQQLAGAKQQMDDPSEVTTLESQIAAAEAELAKLKNP